MPYTIHFMGLACFVKQDDGNYLVAMPDGRNAKSPGTNTPIEPHSPVLVIQASDILNTSEWPGVRFTNNLAFFDIADCALNFQHANAPGPMDATQFAQTMYSWPDIDQTFTIGNTGDPSNVIASAAIRKGTLRAYRIPGGQALIGQVDVPIPQTSDSFQMTATPLYQSNAACAGDHSSSSAPSVPHQVTLKNDAEIVVANISSKFLEQIEMTLIETDDSNHFFIYYVLDTSNEAPNKKLPAAKPEVLESTSRHPFITHKKQRGMNVACSPTHYPGS